MPRCPALAIAIAPSSAQLDELIVRSLDMAIRQSQPEVSEALLCALEALARASGNTKRLDAAYLRLCAGGPPSGNADCRR